MSRITTCLWSPDGRALDMAEYYVSVFPDSKITTTGLYDEPNQHIPESKKWDVMIVEFTLCGDNKFATLNGGPYFQHSCAASWMIPCASQEELDYYYSKLSTVPDAEQCGWICDQFGVSWQLIPANFTEYMRTSDAAKTTKFMKAIMDMKRLSWDAIEEAYNS